MLGWLIETTLVAGGLAALAGAFGRLPFSNSSARHAFWLVVLIRLIMPPIVASPWRFPMPQSPWSGARAGMIAGPAAMPGEDSSAEAALRAALGDRSEATATAGSDPDHVPAVAGNANRNEGPAPAPVLQPAEMPRAARGAPGKQTARAGIPIGRLTLWLWGCGAVLIAVLQGYRLARFRRLLDEASPAPFWLVEEARAIGERLRVKVPEICFVPEITTPMLWCLGPVRLLVPADLVKSIAAERWRGILAHELAHIKRGDPWVCRMELVAGLLWWWNPLYWFVCRQLDAEAELSCDAWAVWALPEERLDYAEALLHVCAQCSRTEVPSPALGIGGAGKFFEKRLTMILHEHATLRVSPMAMLAAGLMIIASLPSGILASTDEPRRVEASARAGSPESSELAERGEPDEDKAAALAPDDDDEDGPGSAQGKDVAKSRTKPAKSNSARAETKGDHEAEDIDKQIESALGPDFEKKLAEILEKLSRDIKQKMLSQSEHAKYAEILARDMEKQFGEESEFARKMKAMGEKMAKELGPGSDFEKKIKEKFGPGSDFEKKIKQQFGPSSDFEKKINQQFGPGSDFEKKIKEKLGPGSDFEKKITQKLGPGSGFEKEIKQQFGPGSGFEKKMKAMVEDMARKHEAELKQRVGAKAASRKSGVKPVRKDRDARIEALERKVKELVEELESLKEAGSEEE